MPKLTINQTDFVLEDESQGRVSVNTDGIIDVRLRKETLVKQVQTFMENNVVDTVKIYDLDGNLQVEANNVTVTRRLNINFTGDDGEDEIFGRCNFEADPDNDITWHI